MNVTKESLADEAEVILSERLDGTRLREARYIYEKEWWRLSCTYSTCVNLTVQEQSRTGARLAVAYVEFLELLRAKYPNVEF